MLPEQQTPIVLTAMTLRGIGSYVQGARLEIKPLTVLCGTNGSGKSTWLKALNVMERALHSNRLPFGFDVCDESVEDIQFINAFCALADAEAIQKLADPEITRQYGSFGTIGLELKVDRDCSLGEPEDQSESDNSLAQEFLWEGKCKMGTCIRIRIAHPIITSNSERIPELVHLIELQINDGPVLRMTRERNLILATPTGLPDRPYEFVNNRPRWDFSCSSIFLSKLSADDDVIVDITDDYDEYTTQCKSVCSQVSSKLAVKVIERFTCRLRQLLTAALEGYFYIGAIRLPHSTHSQKESNASDDELAVKRRCVGSEGEYAWLLERRFSASPMRPVELDAFAPEDVDVQACLSLFTSDASRNSRLSRILAFAAPQEKQELAGFAHQNDIPAEADQCIARLLNSVLNRHDLWDAKVWGTGSIRAAIDEADPDGTIEDYTHFGDPELESLTKQGVDNLSPRALRRLNYLLVEDALNNGNGTERPALRCFATIAFEAYVSSWLRNLTGVGINNPYTGPYRRHFPTFYKEWRSLVHWPESLPQLSASLLIQPTEPRSHENAAKKHYDSKSHLFSSCFGGQDPPQPPQQFSAGFHQIFPIVVQLALMKHGELVGIENPEVHLHPTLQLQLSEALIAHMKGGRRIIIETHSDLVVRRVMRAILEEEIAQSNVQIYFTHLDQSVERTVGRITTTFYGSRIRPIQIDERGRVANWPSGFLDDDIRESQRLLEIMYGGSEEEESDE